MRGHFEGRLDHALAGEGIQINEKSGELFKKRRRNCIQFFS
jgi:hypothetical protein